MLASDEQYVNDFAAAFLGIAERDPNGRVEFVKLFAVACEWLHMHHRPGMPIGAFNRLVRASGLDVRHRPQFVYGIRITY
ncbi:hypothetical protein ADL28_04430 [Streptomyces violaceusniger]|uniref:Uncharacterized protein n=1 Tax=Streptomyces violaceusniger TaxID=68280 RepID=A0A0X3XAR3_STRVO|nr:hypothetical protein [Streptomyces violaceusniger]KUL66095.1 hypothetical protein ADL28_04430 [Streptomyces violaceusniger]